MFVSNDCVTLGAVRVNSQTVKELRGVACRHITGELMFIGPASL